MASLIFHHLRFFSFLFVFALVYTLRIGMAPCGQLLHVGILAALRSNLSASVYEFVCIFANVCILID